MADAPSPPTEPTAVPSWAATMSRASTMAIPGAAPGRGMRLNVAIDVHKLMTGPFVLALMIAFGVYTGPAWIYLALHGSYGVAWLIKDTTFPDRQWQRRVRWRGVLAAWAFLSLYWVAPVILVLGTAGVLDVGAWTPPPPPWLAAAVFVYSLGLMVMIGADIQKNATLLARGRGLITGGFYARTRHPNYLGEMLVYSAFALVAGHWLPWLILAGAWLLFFVPNMLAIDASLRRYAEYGAWRERTGFLLPRIAGRPR